MKKLLWISLFLSLSLWADIQTKLTLFSFQNTYQIFSDEKKQGGLAEMLSLLERERSKSKNHLTLLNGRFLSPLFFSEFDQGQHVIDLLNQMKIDCILFHESCFEYGYSEFIKRKDESTFRWLGVNLIDREKKPISDRCPFVVNIDGIKVGIIALTELQFKDDLYRDVYSVDSQKVLADSLSELQIKGAEVLLIFSNLDRRKNLQLIRNYPQIDVLIASSKGSPLGWYEDDTFVYETGDTHSYLEKIDLIFEKVTTPQDEIVCVYPCWRLIKNQGIDPNVQLADRLDSYQKKCNLSASKKILFLLHQLPENKRPNMNQLFAEALKEHFHADLVFFSKKTNLESILEKNVRLEEMIGHEILQKMNLANLYDSENQARSINPMKKYRVVVVSETKNPSPFMKMGEILKSYLEKKRQKQNQFLRR